MIGFVFRCSHCSWESLSEWPRNISASLCKLYHFDFKYTRKTGQFMILVRVSAICAPEESIESECYFVCVF